MRSSSSSVVSDAVIYDDVFRCDVFVLHELSNVTFHLEVIGGDGDGVNNKETFSGKLK